MATGLSSFAKYGHQHYLLALPSSAHPPLQSPWCVRIQLLPQPLWILGFSLISPPQFPNTDIDFKNFSLLSSVLPFTPASKCPNADPVPRCSLPIPPASQQTSRIAPDALRLPEEPSPSLIYCFYFRGSVALLVQSSSHSTLLLPLHCHGFWLLTTSSTEREFLLFYNKLNVLFSSQLCSNGEAFASQSFKILLSHYISITIYSCRLSGVCLEKAMWLLSRMYLQ